MLELHYLGLVGKRLSKSWQTWALAKRRPARLSEAPRGVFRSCVADWLMKRVDQRLSWASSSTPHSLVALVLFGQWNGDHEGDKAIIAEIVGQPYEEVERDLTSLMSVPDSPLTKVGNRWRLTSHEEAWHLLAPRLTSSDVERFARVATSVFGAVSPEFELPVEERYMANVYGKVLPHSGTLREGIARSLALMGTQADRVKND